MNNLNERIKNREGVVKFMYESAFANIIGKLAQFTIQGITYNFVQNQITFILEEHYPQVRIWLNRSGGEQVLGEEGLQKFSN